MRRAMWRYAVRRSRRQPECKLCHNEGLISHTGGNLNYNANGNYFNSVSQNSKNPDRNIGYHIGLFGKIGTKIWFALTYDDLLLKTQIDARVQNYVQNSRFFNS